MPDFSGGGAEIVNVRVANELSAAGHAVDLVVDRDRGVWRKEVAPTVNVVDLGASKSVLAARPLARYLRARKPDAMVASFIVNSIMAALVRPVSGWKGRLVIAQHNTLSKEHQKLSRGDRRKTFYTIACSAFTRILPMADHVVAVSEGVRADLLQTTRLLPGEISVIYNPVITSDFDARVGAPLDHPWLAPGSPPVFVAAGRLVPQKDYPTMLEALAILRQSVPARLIVLGDGELREALTAKAQSLNLADAVQFAGFQSNPLPYMKSAAALVMTSVFEGFGNVLAEAMACGTPVISTRCNGPVEILQDGRLGTLVPIGDARAVAAAMHDTLVRRPSAAFLQQAAEAYRAKVIAQRYLAVALNRAPPSVADPGQAAASLAGRAAP